MRRKFWVLVLILVILILLSCLVGRYRLGLGEIMNILSGRPSSAMNSAVFYRIRLPRTFLAVISGGALSLAGTVYQSVFKNPMASPDVLGVGSGCSVGAVLAILYGGGSLALLQGLSFFGGLAAVGAALLLTRAIGGGRVYDMILSGIVVGAIANSVIMLLKYVADPNRHLPAIEYWLMGSFNNVGAEDIKSIFPLVLAAGAAIYLMRWRLKILSLGDEEAKSLGMHVGRVRAAALLCATVLVSTVVSVAGSVAWIGLIAPHIVRIFAGDDLYGNLGAAVLMGGILLLLSDILARSLYAAEIPVSILTSFFGAAVLAVFLYKRKNAWR